MSKIVKKLKLELLNDPYNTYGILTEDHNEEIVILESSFKEDEFNKLYNDCLIAISKKIYGAKISINDNVLNDNVLKVYLNPDNVIKMTRNDLSIISQTHHKLLANMSYGSISKFYDKEMCPLSPIEKLTNSKLITIGDKSYPKTHYQFFKYEDFDTFNWTVYYKYISNKYKNKFNKDAPSIDIINFELSRFNKLILELKRAFNRLRPFQSSFIENIPIKTYITYAGQTPAIPSGHSFQGFLFGALVYSNLSEYFLSLDPIELESQMKLLIRVVKDTGHRRVMAGIHYPSDMLASWFVFEIVAKFLNIDKNIAQYKNDLYKELSNY
jgi:PAP2 superfamily